MNKQKCGNPKHNSKFASKSAKLNEIEQLSQAEYGLDAYSQFSYSGRFNSTSSSHISGSIARRSSSVNLKIDTKESDLIVSKTASYNGDYE